MQGAVEGVEQRTELPWRALAGETCSKCIGSRDGVQPRRFVTVGSEAVRDEPGHLLAISVGDVVDPVDDDQGADGHLLEQGEVALGDRLPGGQHQDRGVGTSECLHGGGGAVLVAGREPGRVDDGHPGKPAERPRCLTGVDAELTMLPPRDPNRDATVWLATCYIANVVVLAVLDGTEVDDGTACEIGKFSEPLRTGTRRGAIIGLMTDIRTLRGTDDAPHMNLFVRGYIAT